MKIAVTGASGFIGRYVLAELEFHHQVEVIAVTRDATRLEGLGIAGRVVEMDISVPGKDCFDRLNRPDVLIHLAWDGLPNYKSLHHFETELPRQFCFLKAMVEAGLPSLLVTGTCFEYGMLSGPLSEELVTLPGNPYGYAKDALRRQLEFLKSVKPFDLTWARLFYMYGEGQPKSSLYPQLKDAVLRGEQVFNMSGGEQLRDYLPIEEVARLISILARRQSNIGCVNVSSGKPISVRKLVEGWLAENDWDIDLNLGHYPYPDYEPMAFWGDRHRMDAILNNNF
ncbi:MAG: NAD-dependent epimerase/dehydratase family protein [Sulfuricella sp.]